MHARLLPLLLAVVTTLGCDSASGPSRDQPSPPAGAVAVSRAPLPEPAAQQLLYGGPDTRRRLVIRDADTWATVWPTLAAAVRPTPPPPAIDFATEEVIVAAMGWRGTGGYTITIEEVAETATGRWVVVREVSPGASCFVTQAVTAPVTVVRVPRTTLPVTFLEQRRTQSC